MATQDYEGMNGNKYFKCSLKTSKKCKGRGIIGKDGFQHSKPHNHAPNIASVERAVARAEMRERARTTVEPPHEIRRASEGKISQCAREEMPMGPQVNRYIRRYRSQVDGGPPQPRDAEDVNTAGYGETIGQPGALPERFLLYDSHEDEEYGGKRLMLFASIWWLDNLAANKHWAADGTFKVSPNVFSQVYTIHASVLGYTVPCVYALLSEKTEASYRLMLRQIRLAIERRHPGYQGDGTIITDLERAAMNAFGDIFPDKRQSVCFFHMCKALWKKTREVGLQTAYSEDADLALKVRD